MAIKSPLTLAAAAALALTLPLHTSAQTAPQALEGNRTIASNGHEVITPQLALYRCDQMKHANWDDYKYACSWEHTTFPGGGMRFRNMFFKRFDGTYFYECTCYTSLSWYDPWGSRWTHSKSGTIECYTRDGRTTPSVNSEFDSVSCKGTERWCDTRTGKCAIP